MCLFVKRLEHGRFILPMSSSIDIAELPDDVSALRAMVSALLGDLSAERTARQAAEAGLPLVVSVRLRRTASSEPPSSTAVIPRPICATF